MSLPPAGFPPDQRSADAGLSPAAGRFLDAVEADPRLLLRRTFEPALAAAREVIPTLVGFDAAKPYGLEPWPVLITAERRAELARTIEGFGRLVRGIPRRFFAGYAEAVARYHGLESPLLAAVFLAEPTGIAETICRGDVVDTTGGLRVVEFNFGTRRVERRAVERGGVERALPEMLLADRGAFVLKAATAVGGQGAVAGVFATPEEWRAAVERALAEGSWIAQEYLDTPTFPFQSGDEGWTPHRLVWGPFLFGDDFGGLFVRVLPVAGGPVVNLGRGAQVALAFTVGA